jgi:hypothetical protein
VIFKLCLRGEARAKGKRHGLGHLSIAISTHNGESRMTSSTAAFFESLDSKLCRRSIYATTLVFSATSFLSAFLLFQMQLIVSKTILPWFGGSAAVWTTSMLMFQLLLLGGYIYSHVISARVSAITQTRIHLALLLIAFLMVVVLSFMWPSAITPGASWKPRADGDPTRDVMAIILISSGCPFFVLSTTAPLLQRWFARLGGGSGTYKLYSISNMGSLLGLLTFPFLLEPTIGIATQGRIWSVLFGVFIAGCALCAWQATSATEEIQVKGRQVDKNVGQATTATRVSWVSYAMWFLLAACPSSLLLATTNLLCQQVTTVSLLWVLPLSIYLLTFILCFDSPRWYRRSFFHSLFAVALFLTCAGLIVNNILSQALLLPLLLFSACMICHGELVRMRPGVERLTSFYLCVSAGGAAGGIFVGVVAPHIFTFFTEFQLTVALIVVLLLVCLALDSDSWIFERSLWPPALITVGVIFTAYLAGRRFPLGIPQLLERSHFYFAAVLTGTVVMLGTYFLDRRQGSGLHIRGHFGKTETRLENPRLPIHSPSHASGFRLVQVYIGCIVVLALAALYRTTRSFPEPYLSSRNFYGAVRVFRQAHATVLVHGRTVHGLQLDAPNDRVGTTYYGRNSAIGILLQNHPKRTITGKSLRVGLVGLGAGTLATYGQTGDYFRYYEINPDVIRLSSGPVPLFTYVRDSAARIDIELGDARLLLERELAKGDIQNFDVLVLDAFAGGTVPVHLLTREAFDTYWQHMDPNGGIVAVNITSGHIDLSPVLQGVTEHFHAASILYVDDSSYPCKNNRWVLLARSPSPLNIPGLKQTPLSAQLQIPPRLWTDDYSDIFRLERYFHFPQLPSFHR